MYVIIVKVMNKKWDFMHDTLFVLLVTYSIDKLSPQSVVKNEEDIDANERLNMSITWKVECRRLTKNEGRIIVFRIQ